MSPFKAIPVIMDEHCPQRDMHGYPWAAWHGDKLMMHPDTFARMRHEFERFRWAVWIQQTLRMRYPAL